MEVGDKTFTTYPSIRGDMKSIWANEYSTTDQGSSWDNMTLFDVDGKATSALYVFNDVLGKNSILTGK